MTKPIPEWAREGQEVEVKLGWHEEGRRGVAVGLPVFVEQFWLPVKWEDEEDPNFFKLAGLLPINIARPASQPLTQDLKHGSYTCPLCRQSTVKPVQPSASIRERAERAAARVFNNDETYTEDLRFVADIIASHFADLPTRPRFVCNTHLPRWTQTDVEFSCPDCEVQQKVNQLADLPDPEAVRELVEAGSKAHIWLLACIKEECQQDPPIKVEEHRGWPVAKRLQAAISKGKELL